MTNKPNPLPEQNFNLTDLALYKEKFKLATSDALRLKAQIITSGYKHVENAGRKGYDLADVNGRLSLFDLRKLLDANIVKVCSKSRVRFNSTLDEAA